MHVCNFFNQKIICYETSKWLWKKVSNKIENYDNMKQDLGIQDVSKYTMSACYGPGGHFGLHTDTGLIDDIKKLESKYTMLIYLNDNFEGGETVFYDDNFRKTVQITPKTGMALFFDISLWHKGCPIQTGEKYWVVTELMTKLYSM